MFTEGISRKLTVADFPTILSAYATRDFIRKLLQKGLLDGEAVKEAPPRTPLPRADAAFDLGASHAIFVENGT